MSDNADIANDYIEWHLERGIKNLPKLEGPSLASCQECGEPIPEKRRLALSGIKTCIECQQETEAYARHFGVR